VDFLRSPEDETGNEFARLLDHDAVLVCGPVAAELLAGTTPPRREQLWNVLARLRWADLDRTAWRRIGELAADLRAAGASVPLTDVMIAVAAIDAKAELWSQDSDFRRIAEAVTLLSLYSP
jgi:predicted nucleic acid-binding protein